MKQQRLTGCAQGTGGYPFRRDAEVHELLAGGGADVQPVALGIGVVLQLFSFPTSRLRTIGDVKFSVVLDHYEQHLRA